MNREKNTTANLWWKKYLFILITLGVLGLISLPFFLNWREFEFTLRKPQIIRGIRLEYERRQRSLEKSFIEQEKTPEEKLIEAVTEELKK